LRDRDILAEMAKQSLVSVTLSITTLDKHLARKMEPRAPTPPRRLQAIAGLAEAGLPVGVLAAPMIPALNDMELEAILAAAAKAGASAAGYVLLRLPLEIADLFGEWLATHAPAKAKHVLNLIRQTRRGSLYVDAFGERQKGTGPYAELLAARFRLAARRYGLERRNWEHRTDLFSVPPRRGDQLSLL
jgi:DNA repair photolyase